VYYLNVLSIKIVFIVYSPISGICYSIAPDRLGDEPGEEDEEKRKIENMSEGNKRRMDPCAGCSWPIS